TADAVQRPGEIIGVTDELSALPPIQTVLTAPTEVPVRLFAHLTEVGTLEISLHMVADALPTWKLDFSTRAEEADAGGEAVSREALPARMDEAKELVESFFGQTAKVAGPGGVKQLRRKLETVLGPREEWSVAVSRE